MHLDAGGGARDDAADADLQHAARAAAGDGRRASPTSVLPPLGGVNIDADPTNNHLIFDDRFIPPRIDTSYATGAGYSKVKTFGFSGMLDARLTDSLEVKSITAYRNLDTRFALDVDGSPIPMGDHAFTMRQQQ